MHTEVEPVKDGVSNEQKETDGRDGACVPGLYRGGLFGLPVSCG